jgi:hypothetical protein
LHDFVPGPLFFRLEGPCGHGRSLLARVVRVTPQGGGDWLPGCALAGPAGESDLRAFRAAAGEVARLAAEALRRGPGRGA